MDMVSTVGKISAFQSRTLVQSQLYRDFNILFNLFYTYANSVFHPAGS